MYIINEGKVEILNQVGDEEQVLAILEKGDFFGEMSVLEDLPRAASARAATDVRLLQINGSTFDQLLRGNPEIAVRMMRKLSRRCATRTSAELRLGTRSPRECKPGSRRAAEGRRSGLQLRPAGSSPATVGDDHRPQGPVTGASTSISRRSTTSPVAAALQIYRGGQEYYRRGDRHMNSRLNGKRMDRASPPDPHGDELRAAVVVSAAGFLERTALSDPVV